MSHQDRGSLRGRGHGPPPARGGLRSGSRGGSLGRSLGESRGRSRGGRGGRGGRSGLGGGRGDRGRRGDRGGRDGDSSTILAGNTATSLVLRHSDAALNNLIGSLNSIQLNPESPSRPGWGTAGRPITLRANFFVLRLPKQFLVYDYGVSITPDVYLQRPIKARIFELLEGSPECAPHMGFIAHDSRQRLVSTRQLPQPLAITIIYTEAGQIRPATNPLTFVVKINFVRILNMEDITP
jgi:eukaryotic translation initiation factor 2C